MTTATRPLHRHALLAAEALVLGITVLLVYAAGLRGPFLMDDFDAIFPLAAAQSSGMEWSDVLRNAPSHIRERWLSNLSFLLSHAAAGGTMPPSAAAFKLGNLLLHLACGAALFALAWRLARAWGADVLRAQRVAWLAAAIFLLHPLLVSTVLYPVQRMAQLSTLFLLLAVHAWLRWRERYAALDTRGHVLGIALAGGFALLALLAKESGALAPLLFLVVELTALRWPTRDAPARSRFDTGFGLLCAGPLLLGAIALGVRWERIVGGYARRDFSLGERLLTEVHVLADYLGQIAWPRIASLGLYRDDFPLHSTLQPATLVLALGFGAAIGFALATRRRWRALAFGILWFFAAHVLESTVIALELVFEHRNYLALAGPALAAAWAITALRPARLAAIVALVVVSALALQTWRRTQDWSGYERWITTEATHHPRSLRAASDLMLHQVARGDIAAAVGTRERIAAELPGHAQPLLLKLAFACRGVVPVKLFVPDELHALQTGEIGKDAFHAYVGLREQIALPGRCDRIDWGAFAAASGAIAVNPRIEALPRAAAAWWRLHADARQRLSNWPAVQQAIVATLRREDRDPRDWLLLAEAAARNGDRALHAQARQRALQLLQGRPGPLAREFARIDALAAQVPEPEADGSSPVSPGPDAAESASSPIPPER